MKNYLGPGKTVVVTAPEAVSSGEFIKVGSLYGVAPVAAESGAPVVLDRSGGVYELPKVSGAAWAQGQKLFWDASEKKFTVDASKSPIAAIAFAAAAELATEGEVLLEGPELKIVGGQHTTVAATDTIVTGLSKVLGVIATYDTDPADANTYVSATIGDQAGAPAAGSIIVKTWKQSGTDPTPIAADAFAKKVNWLAFGY